MSKTEKKRLMAESYEEAVDIAMDEMKEPVEEFFDEVEEIARELGKDYPMDAIYEAVWLHTMDTEVEIQSRIENPKKRE